MSLSPLFEPLELGPHTLSHRVIMAPLTRMRATVPGNVPNEMNAEHYGQRASEGGLIIAEASQVLPGGKGGPTTPGIHSAEQVEGWKGVVRAVHAKGGRVFLQLWHVGRISHPSLQPDGGLPVAPSAVAAEGAGMTADFKRAPFVTPRALRLDEIPGIVQAYAQAARNALEAGFDGVEVHGANGYLLDEFLRDGSNRRTGPYGGPIEHRARLMFEVVEALCEVWGGDRVGLRISPLNSYNSMIDSDPVGMATWVARRANDFNLAYLHVMRGDALQQQQGDVLTPVRAAYRGVLVGNMGYTAEEAEQAIASGKLDAVAFGVSFLANPDLPARIKAGAAYNQPDPATFYTQGAEGYIDYPSMTV